MSISLTIQKLEIFLHDLQHAGSGTIEEDIIQLEIQSLIELSKMLLLLKMERDGHINRVHDD